MRIGVISDTHNLLRQEVIDDLKTCDYILHAGDIMKIEILEKLKEIAPVIAVKGNNDQLQLQEEEYFELEGYRFYMIHQLGEVKDVDFYIYGHSHQYTCYQDKGILFLNPGSCGRKRFSLPLTYAIIEIENHEYRIIKRELH